MQEKYHPNIEINYLKRIAEDNLSSAILLYNQKLHFSSMHLFHESLEKYLKVLWAQENSSELKNKEDFQTKLKNFGHDILKIVDSLSEEKKQKIDEFFKTDGLTIYQLTPLRFAEITFLNVSDYIFIALKKVINNIKEELLI